jgi:hypothetical protein
MGKEGLRLRAGSKASFAAHNGVTYNEWIKLPQFIPRTGFPD